jgi:hypothetical protein
MAMGLAIDGNYLYVAANDSGLTVMDITNPGSPTIVSSIDTVGYAYDVCINGSYAYIANWWSVQIINITNPLSPIYVASYDSVRYACDIDVENGLACVADNIGMQLIDVSNPAQPDFLGGYMSYTGSMGNIMLAGDFAFGTDGSEGLLRFNISNRSNPTVYRQYNSPGLSKGFAIRDGIAYLCDYYSLIVLGFEPDGIADEERLPEQVSLISNYPNPFNNETTIEFSLEQASNDNSINIYDISGRRVKDIDLGALSAGAHRITWDGRGRDGQALSSGIYFFKLKAGHSEQTRKMVLVR